MVGEPPDDGGEPNLDRPASESAGDASSLGSSAIFDVLSNERARLVLYLLDARGGTIPIDELASRIATWQRDGSAGSTGGDSEQRIVRDLYHVHLPKLTDYGIATFDRTSGAVTLRDRAGDLDSYLAFAKDRERGDVSAFTGRGWRHE